MTIRWLLAAVVAVWYVGRLVRPPTSSLHNNRRSFDPELNTWSRSYYYDTPMKKQQSHSIAISDEAWQQFLQQFQSSMQQVPMQLWLPVVIRGDDLLFRPEHVYQFASYNRIDAFVQMMLYALRRIPPRLAQQPQQGLPIWKQQDIPIPLLLGIGDHHECASSFPRFTWCTTPNHDTVCQTIAIPSFNLFLSRPETGRPRGRRSKLPIQQDFRYMWSMKKRLAVWRGAPTGRTVAPDHAWTSLPRVQLVNYSLAFPHLLDAAFVTTKQFQTLFPDQVPQLRRQTRFAKRIPVQDFQTYRAIVDIDGNSWSSRFGELLCMNSVVIKVQPNNKNYFYDELRPWQHYIPVHANLSDLIDMIQMVVSNETLARSIVRNANEWCQQRLTRESMALDVFWKLHWYVHMLGMHDNATRRHQWEAVWNVYQHDQALVPIRPRLGISHWNIPWRMAKPFHYLLRAVGLGT